MDRRSDRPALLSALASRPASAEILLDAVAAARVPRTDITPFLARQIESLGAAPLSRQLAEVWGTVRSSDSSRRAAIERLRGDLSAERLKSADLSRGRQVYSQLCAPCHRLYGEGAEVGPDLTGSGRGQLDYLLENLVDPNSLVPADYRMTIITLKDGRVLNGLLRQQTDRTVTLQMQNERNIFERAEIVAMEQSEQSMMPEGMLEALPADPARDLLASDAFPAGPLPLSHEWAHLQCGRHSIPRSHRGNEVHTFSLFHPCDSTGKTAAKRAPMARGLVIFAALLSVTIRAAHWPQYRGPNASGVDDSRPAPIAWEVGSGENILWKTPIPGLAHASPSSGATASTSPPRLRLGTRP